jgi:hypothetical protein
MVFFCASAAWAENINNSISKNLTCFIIAVLI